MKKSIFACLVFACLSSIANADTIMGVNVNGQLERISPSNTNELDALNVEWTRGFIRFFDFLEGEKDLKTDKALKGFLDVSKKSQYKTIFSIRWDFVENNLRIPENGTARMQEYVSYLKEVLDHVGPHVDKFVISNEPMWETKSEDRKYNTTDKRNPTVVFFKRIANIVKDWKNANNGKFDIYVGAFNRLENTNNSTADDVVKMINFAKNTSWIKGIDVHAHHPDMDSFKRNIAKARQMLGNSKDILVTEYSLVYRWNRNIKKKISSKFAGDYNYNTNWTVVDYLSHVQQKPVSQGEWNAFFNSLSWWVPQFPKLSFDIFSQHNVGVTAYALGLNKALPPQRAANAINADGTAWYLNGLYQGRFVAPNNAGLSTHAFIFDDFKKLNK